MWNALGKLKNRVKDRVIAIRLELGIWLGLGFDSVAVFHNLPVLFVFCTLPVPEEGSLLAGSVHYNHERRMDQSEMK